MTNTPGHNELFSLLTVEDEVNNMMNALKIRKIALDERTPLLRAAQLHFFSLAKNQHEHVGAIPLEIAKYLASTDYELKQRVAQQNKASTSKQDDSTAIAVEAEDLLNGSTKTAIEPLTHKDVLNMSTETVVEPEDELNISTMTAVEAEEEDVVVSIETALEPEDFSTAIAPEADLNESVHTAIEQDEDDSLCQDKSTVELTKEVKKEKNYTAWCEQLKKIRENPTGDHSQMLKKILKEMKSAWF